MRIAALTQHWIPDIGLAICSVASRLHGEIGESNDSREFLFALNEWLDGLEVPKEAKPILLASRALLYNEQGLTDRAVECNLASLSLSEALTDEATDDELAARCAVAPLLTHLERYAEAYEVAEAAHVRRLKQPPSERHASLCILQGNAALVMENFLEALNAYAKAQCLFSKLGDSLGEAWALERISLAHTHGHDQLQDPRASPTEAVDTRRQAIALYRKAQALEKEISARTNLIHLLFNSGEWSSSVRECMDASSRCEHSQNIEEACKFIAQAGFIIETLGQKEQAMNCYQDALSRFGSTITPSLCEAIALSLHRSTVQSGTS